MDHGLPDLPARFNETRDALHRVAYFALAPARYARTERLGLRAHPGTFSTPTWNDDEQAWVDGDVLHRRSADGTEHHTSLTTLDEACAFLGIEFRDTWFDFHDPLPAPQPDERLDIDVDAAEVLGAWFDFGTAVLEDLRQTEGAIDPSPVQLWPEHFDPATELGDVDAGTRASFGASPGDAEHDEPYLYVSPWTKRDRPGAYWNDEGFGGASLGYTELRAAADPHAAALAFLREGYDRLIS